MVEKKAKSLVGPLRGSMKLKKAPKPKAAGAKAAKPKVFMIATGTISKMGDAKGFDSEAKMRSKAATLFSNLRPWCKRFNSAGDPNITEAIKAIDQLGTFDSVSDHRRRIECIFDPGRDDNAGILVVEMWRIAPPSIVQTTLLK